jgi:uncharacterized membrane protein YphA (DoxX/SURF4 family)
MPIEHKGFSSTESPMRYPERWLAVLRIVIGCWFAKTVVTKVGMTLVGGVIPLPGANARWTATMPKLLARYAAENPVPGYSSFIENTVIPHAGLFANLTALGELTVGICLTLGLLTVLGASVGLLLTIMYGLATQHMSPGQQGFHILLLVSMLAFIFARAGRVWGIDALLRRRWPGAWWVRFPLS